MDEDEYFTKLQERKEIINNMVNFCLNNVNKKIEKNIFWMYFNY